jgi:hypothetical protein
MYAGKVFDEMPASFCFCCSGYGVEGDMRCCCLQVDYLTRARQGFHDSSMCQVPVPRRGGIRPAAHVVHLSQASAARRAVVCSASSAHSLGSLGVRPAAHVSRLSQASAAQRAHVCSRKEWSY